MKNKKDVIIGVGVDQGVANCGFGVVQLSPLTNEIELICSGVVVTKADLPMPQRMLIIFNTISQLLTDNDVDIMGCERLFFNKPKKGKPQSGEPEQKRNKSAYIMFTNLATGALCVLAGQHSVPLQEFVPGTVKKAVTGKGNAAKEEVEEAVKHLIGPRPKKIANHETDAVAIAITAVRYYQEHEQEILNAQVS